MRTTAKNMVSFNTLVPITNVYILQMVRKKSNFRMSQTKEQNFSRFIDKITARC
jgi:hypothetical protein